MRTPGWSFDYRPLPGAVLDDGGRLRDAVIALETPAPTDRIERAVQAAVGGFGGGVATVKPVLERPPIAWYRLRAEVAFDRHAVASHLRTAGMAVRYVAATQHGGNALAPDLAGAPRAEPLLWTTRPERSYEEPSTPGRWFLGPRGAAVDRAVCGTGAGTRLAVIDADLGHLDDLDLDALVLVGTEAPESRASHGATMIAWATRTGGEGPPWVGVAPDASTRLYLIPKAGQEVLSLAEAIARATFDGADVIACATYVHGHASPMLDDALQLASQHGRGGRGTPVLMSVSREVSSAPGSVHASLSLGLSEPPSDPRVYAVGPSGNDGGWFLWRGRRGGLRPFANRGPSVRFLAPGDDIAFPFVTPETMWHAESSGAMAVAAGVTLLVLGCNPQLSLAELDEVLVRTTAPVTPPSPAVTADLADAADVQPLAIDPDGHNAKSGYGRLHARNACLFVACPVAAAFVAIGEPDAAARVVIGRRSDRAWQRLYPDALARLGARAFLRDRGVAHTASTLARHLRLRLHQSGPGAPDPPGTVARHATLLAREVARVAEEIAPDARRPLQSLVAAAVMALDNPADASHLDESILSRATAALCAIG